MIDSFKLIPLIPFACAALTGLIAYLDPQEKRKGLVNLVAVGGIGATMLLALGVLWSYVGAVAPQPVEQILYAWTAGPLSIDVAFLLDPLSAVMLFVVTFVGFWIHVYSIGYMSHDEGYARFFAYMNLFMGAMLLLVLGNNFLVAFVGWEGVGLCSYLLIGFYYKEYFPPQAGRKAFIVNRIGDFAFLVGLFALVASFDTLNYRDLFGLMSANPSLVEGEYALGMSLATFVALCLFIGAIGKSAQIPLYVWLPDAMAGPTPVSALIHAATMVTAGVYIVARANFLYQMAPGTSLFVAGIGAATAIFAASIGLAQNDIKKVLAYSTVSQLGYMFLAAGVGAYTAAIFHLGTHAFFKALLFLGSGSVIHAMSGEQNMQKMGGLKDELPVTYRTFLVGALAISGIPPLAGFFSKDEILAASAGSGHWILWAVGLLTAGLTAFYMFRAVYLTFHGSFRGTEEQRKHLHESPAVMTVPLVILALGAVGAGWLGISKVITLEKVDLNLFHHFLEPIIAEVPHAGEAHHLGLATEWVLIVLSVALAVAAILFARSLFKERGLAADEAFAARSPAVHRLLVHKYWVDELYDRTIVQPLARLAELCRKVIDGLVIEGTLRVGTLLAELTGDFGRLTTTGNVRDYAFYLFLGIIVLFWWIFI